MFYNAEFEELKEICGKRRITPEKLLEEKFAPLQDKISKSQGELVGALTRCYEQRSFGMVPPHYSLRKNLYAGVITGETRFPLNGGSFSIFLSGVKNPHSLELNSAWEMDFIEEKNCIFSNYMTDSLTLLYFMDKPAHVPEDSFGHEYPGGSSIAFPTKKSRLELYIGNQDALPFLQQNLEGWRYIQLPKLLGCELPMTPEMEKKIEGEHLKIFDEIREAEAKVRSLINEKEARLKLVEAADGVIHHGASIELTDEVAEALRYNPKKCKIDLNESKFRFKKYSLKMALEVLNKKYSKIFYEIGRNIGKIYKTIHLFGYTRGISNSWYGNELICEDGNIGICDLESCFSKKEVADLFVFEQLKKTDIALAKTAFYDSMNYFENSLASFIGVKLIEGFEEGYRTNKAEKLNAKEIKKQIHKFNKIRGYIIKND